MMHMAFAFFRRQVLGPDITVEQCSSVTHFQCFGTREHCNHFAQLVSSLSNAVNVIFHVEFESQWFLFLYHLASSCILCPMVADRNHQYNRVGRHAVQISQVLLSCVGRALSCCLPEISTRCGPSVTFPGAVWRAARIMWRVISDILMRLSCECHSSGAELVWRW